MIAMVNASHSRLHRTDPGRLHVELWTPWSPDAPVTSEPTTFGFRQTAESVPTFLLREVRIDGVEPLHVDIADVRPWVSP